MATLAFEPLLSPVTAALAGLALRAASIIAVRSAIILASPSSNDSAKVLPRRVGLQPHFCWRRSWRSSGERRAPSPRVSWGKSNSFHAQPYFGKFGVQDFQHAVQ